MIELEVLSNNAELSTSGIAYIKGDKGDKGDTGPQGEKGETGATGPQGPQGPAGTTTWSGITDKPSTFPPAEHNHDERYYTETEVNNLLNAKEDKANKVTSVSASSTDTQYPTAKCLYTIVGNIETILYDINSGNGGT